MNAQTIKGCDGREWASFSYSNVVDKVLLMELPLTEW
jgi:hypothetical protein